jgi:hypothetical protein
MVTLDRQAVGSRNNNTRAIYPVVGINGPPCATALRIVVIDRGHPVLEPTDHAQRCGSKQKRLIPFKFWDVERGSTLGRKCHGRAAV